MDQQNNNIEFNLVSGVENIPGSNVSAILQSVDTSAFLWDDAKLTPKEIDGIKYMPWGDSDDFPRKLLDTISEDETLSACQIFNTEVAYGSGLIYNSYNCTDKTKSDIDDFFLRNNMPSYFLGACLDMKYFMFSASVIMLNADASRIVKLCRKQACYCRFSPADNKGRIKKLYYANWENSPGKSDIEDIDLLDLDDPWGDLAVRLGRESNDKGVKENTSVRKFAIVTRFPSPDNRYYPNPYYTSIFRSNWFDIKKLIGIAKKSKIGNTAPIKYHVQILNKYWEELFKSEGITSPEKMKERIIKAKEEIISFLTGVENSGKAWFSPCYITPDGKEVNHIRITEITTTKEGGDWSTDIVEAVNMICFTLRVHSNLVGSVPGKTQSNNSGSDKRELYTIAQALQKPYHDIMFLPHKIVIKYNGWDGAYPDCPFIQLTTLDEKKDAKKVTTSNNNSDENN